MTASYTQIALPRTTLLHLSPTIRSIGLRLAMVLSICTALTFVTDSFLSASNLSNVLRQASLLFIIASGATIVMLAGGIDLSIGSTVTLAAVLAAGTVHATQSSALGFAVGLLVGGGVGLANGLFVARLGLPSFLVTYGMLWIINGASLFYSAGSPIFGMPQGFRYLGNGFFLGISVPILLMLTLLVAGSFLLTRTVIGRQLYFMGANKTAARLSGLPVTRNLVLAYVLSGMTAGLAALIFIGRVNSADPGMGEALLLPAIGAILIGGTSLAGGVGGLFQTLLGALLLTLILNGMNLLNVKTQWQPFVTGLVLVSAMLVDTFLNRSKN